MSATPIIWITWDEAHKDTLSLYGAGTHRTPNVDALAACSHNYTNAYTCSPVCLPARCSMATGLMPHHSCSLSNRTGGALRNDLPHVFHQMHAMHYKTSVFGKCHFMPVPYPVTRPDVTLDGEHILAYYRSLGIDTLVCQDDKNCSAWFYDDFGKVMELEGVMKPYRDARMKRENGNVFPFPGPDDLHPDRWVADQAIEYIRQAQDNEFIWVSFSGPHYPIDTPKSYTEKIDLSKLPPRKLREGEFLDKTKLHAQSYYGPGVTEGSGQAPGGAQCNFTQEYWDRWQKGYRGNVLLLDDCMGDLIAAIRERYGNNALIVFTADHGDMSGHHGIWAKNSAAYEDVLCIPMMIHLPGQTQGVTHDEYASNLDILPTTMRHAFGVDMHADGRNAIDPATAPDTIFSEKDYQVAVIHDGQKLVLTQHKGQMYQELYDLTRDPNEFENVFSDPAYAAVAQSLKDRLSQDETRMPRVFYDGQGMPYWMAPLQKGLKLRPTKS